MATCGSNKLLDDINKAIDEVTSAIDEAISDVNEGIAAAIDEIEGAISDAVNAVNDAIDGLIPDLPETNTTLILEAAALFALRDNPAAFAAAAVALAAKYGNAPGVDMDTIINKMLSGNFDPCKDVPNIEVNDKGEITQKGTVVAPPVEDAVKIEPNEPARDKTQVVSGYPTDQNSADVVPTQTAVELQTVTVQAEPAIQEPPPPPVKEIIVEHFDELRESTTPWATSKGVQAGKFYPTENYRPNGMYDEEYTSLLYYKQWEKTRKVRLAALNRYLDLAKNVTSVSGNAEITKAQLTTSLKQKIDAKEAELRANDKAINDFANHVALNKDQYPYGSKEYKAAVEKVEGMQEDSNTLYEELVSLQEEYDAAVNGISEELVSNDPGIAVGDIESEIARIEGLKPSASAPPNAINFLERSPDEKFWTP